MGRNEMHRVDGGQGDPGARSMAQAAWIVGLIGTIILALGIIFLLFMVGVFAITS